MEEKGRRQEAVPQEEDTHGVLTEPGVPAGVHLRHEAVPEQLGARRPGRVPSPDGDSGEDLVSEQEEQVEKAAGGGARGRQPEPRCGAEDSPGAHPLPRELGLGERRRHRQRARQPTAPHFPAPGRLLLPSHRNVCAAAQTSLKTVEFLGTSCC